MGGDRVSRIGVARRREVTAKEVDRLLPRIVGGLRVIVDAGRVGKRVPDVRIDVNFVFLANLPT